MKLSRRALLASAALAASTFWADPAAAWLASGASNTQTLLTTMTVSETTGSTVAANSIPPMFGHPFKKGDIKSGKWPQFKLTDGTNVPFTMFNVNRWSDSSLKHAGFLILLPVGIAANSSVTINIYNNGASPGASSRSTSDFTAADLRCRVTGLDNLSGDWTSLLNDGIANTNQAFAGGAPDIVSYADGAVGRVWRVRASFEQSSAAHGQMECYWYVAALQDASGGLYGIRYLGRLTQPWYNSTNTPTRTFRSFSAFSTLTGTTPIRDLFATYLQPQTFTFQSGNQFNATTTNRLQSGMAVQVSSSGTLPTGLSAATTYWLYVPGNGHIQFSTAAQPSTVGNSIVTISGAGTGTLTLTPITYCCQFGSLWTNQDTATWDYIQGGGSIAADVTLRCSFNKTYWHATKMVPPLDLTVNPTSNAAQVMFPGWGGPVLRATTTTGERDDIGVISAWAARHFLTQAAVDETVVRVVGLAGGQWSIHLRDTTTKSLPVANNNTYSGMPAANNAFQWAPQGGGSSSVTGFTIPSNNNCLSCFNNQETSHIPSFSYYAYLLTGEPQFLDNIAEFANNALINRNVISGTAAVDGTQNTFGGKRTVTISAVQRFGILLNSGQLRADAWGLRDLAAAAALQPGNPENASYATYFNDLLTDNWAAAVAFNGIQTSFWLANGILGFQDGGKPEGPGTVGMWMHGYFQYANAFAYAVTENADALTFLNHVVKLPAAIRTAYGAWSIATYQYIYRTADTTTGPVITAISQLGCWGQVLSWASGGQFTVTPQGGYVLTNGDAFHFVTEEGGPPTGFSALVPYYVVNAGNAGANKFDLSATVGGAPIVLTNSGNANPAFLSASAAPATGFISADTNDGYGANVSGGLQYATALGATVDAACISDMLARMAGDGVTFTSNPKYGMVGTF